jgi:FkbM family methyltransferase
MMKTCEVKVNGFDMEIPVFFKSMLDSMFNWEYKFQQCKFDKDKGYTVLDIGGNVGLFSVIAMTYFGVCRIIAYEPDPENAALYRKNMAKFSNVHLFEKAVWNKTCKMTLNKSKTNPGAHSLVMPIYTPGESVEVECVDAATLPVCMMIKVDAEGSEYQILSRYLRNVCRPTLIAYEYHSDSDCRKLERLIKSMDDANYRQVGGVRLGFHTGTACWIDMMCAKYNAVDEEKELKKIEDAQ